MNERNKRVCICICTIVNSFVRIFVWKMNLMNLIIYYIALGENYAVTIGKKKNLSKFIDDTMKNKKERFNLRDL